jgi:hypothetical protein
LTYLLHLLKYVLGKRCTSTGRKCDGYESPKTLHNSSALLTLSPPPHHLEIPKWVQPTFSATYQGHGSDLPASISASFKGTTQEHRLFLRFQYCTVPVLAGASESGFWMKIVLQLGQVDPIIRSVVVALGALHEDYQGRQGKYVANLIEDRSYRDAICLYGKALGGVRRELSMPSKIDVKLAIVASILFCCFEVLRRKNMFMVTHHKFGMEALIRQIRLPKTESSSSHTEEFHSADPPMFGETPQNELDELLRVLARYDIQSKTITFSPNVEHLRAEVASPPPIPPASSTPSQIRLHTENLLIAIYQLTKSDMRIYRYWKRESVPQEWKMQHGEAINTFNTWVTFLKSFFQSQVSRQDWDPIAFTILLGHLLQIEAAAIVLKLSIDCGPETSFDGFREEFEDMVARVERTTSALDFDAALPLDIEHKPFTMEFGIVQPLFFIAIKCRDWDLRRRAVAQLRRAGKEGVLEGPILAVLARRVMILEEGDLSWGSVIPETNRFHEIKFSVEYDSREIMLEATTTSDSTWKIFVVHKEVIPF